MVEVFTTNVRTKIQAEPILKLLENYFSELEFNFDLDDSDSQIPFCHNILRVEGATINSEKIIALVNQAGFKCTILEDKICK
ncbi:hypothetical protein CNR22_03715 [Sphingobacteriaceae bacterium]|nr:hypothetical protein CNR22_03715 [Sphingobacteriaceae bacterium]